MASIKECSVVRSAATHGCLENFANQTSAQRAFFVKRHTHAPAVAEWFYQHTKARALPPRTKHTDTYILHWRRVRIQTVRGVIKNYGHKM